jgi:hypothetical protein
MGAKRGKRLANIKRVSATLRRKREQEQARGVQKLATPRENVREQDQGRNYLGVLGVVFSALAAGVFGLVGASIGADSAVRGVEMQVEANAAQTHVAFLKEKRIHVYTSWLDSINELVVKEQAALDAADTFLDTREPDALRESLQDASEHLVAMESLEVQISIVGSAEVSTAASKMIIGHGTLIDEMEAVRDDPSLAPRLEEIPTPGELERTLSELEGPDGSTSSSDRKKLEAMGLQASDTASELAKILAELKTDDEFSRLMDSIRDTAEGGSRARWYSLLAQNRVETEYDEFISASRADLAIEAHDPSPGWPRD